MNTQVTSAIAKLKHGAKRNKTQLDLTGIITSLSSSFKPSANAWRTPQNPVTLGPLRLCIEASNLRSAMVKNAIVSKEAIRVISIINIIQVLKNYRKLLLMSYLMFMCNFLSCVTGRNKKRRTN